MSSLAQPHGERAEVAVVRHPIADARNNAIGHELRFGGSVDLGDPAMDANPRMQNALLDHRTVRARAADAGRAIGE